MGRYSRGESYSHTIKRLGENDYRISWVVDFHYSDSMLRFPRRFSRYTNKDGAIRFSKKWNVAFPDNPKG